MSSSALRGAADTLRVPVVCLALLGAAAPQSAAAQPSVDARIELLEAKLRALTERVSALEADGGDAAPDDGAVVWLLDDDLRGRPFSIVNKALYADQGRVELLLRITEALPDTGRWVPGGPTPIRMTLTALDGSERSLDMTLLRGASMEPGKHIHLVAEMDPATVAAARRILIEHAN